MSFELFAHSSQPAARSQKNYTMPNPRVASRYAKSLLDFAVEKGQLETVYSDMLYLQRLTKESREFLNLLRSPVIKSETKLKALEAVTAGKISDLTMGFVRLMTTKTREGLLPEIITAFISQYKDKKGIRVVKLTTAMPVSDAVKAAIIEQVKKATSIDKLELEEVVNPSIIGGFILQAGDQLVDASIAYDLKQVSRKFENNDFVYRVR
jgi:F-type H+-transporting ATPase subunit delta